MAFFLANRKNCPALARADKRLTFPRVKHYVQQRRSAASDAFKGADRARIATCAAQKRGLDALSESVAALGIRLSRHNDIRIVAIHGSRLAR